MANSSVNASALSTIRMNDEALVAAAQRLGAIATSFSKLEQDQITPSMVQAVGYEVAMTAVSTARSEIDDHESRVTAGITDDELMLLRTVQRYRANEMAAAGVAATLTEQIAAEAWS